MSQWEYFLRSDLPSIGLPAIFWTLFYFAWNYYIHGEALSQGNIVGGLLGGSYYHLWFLYLIVGLYLATPILRIVVKYIDRQRFKYFLILWGIGSFAVPFIQLFIGFNYNPILFVFTGWIGYFLLGVFLLKSQVSKRLIYLGLILGLMGAIIGDAVVPALAGYGVMGFFHEYLVFTTIIASAALFLLLIAIPKSRFERNTVSNRLLHWISQNTLPIYLIHVMVLETVQTGYLGFTLNSNMITPIIEVPLLTMVTFLLSAVIVYPLKKIPYVNKIIG